MQNQANWTTAFYMEGDQQQYRGPDAIGAAIDKLRRIRRPMDELDEQATAGAKVAKEKRRSELRAMLKEHFVDHYQRDQGIRQTFAPGYIRRRRVAPSDIAQTNHLRAMAEHQRAWGNQPA